MIAFFGQFNNYSNSSHRCPSQPRMHATNEPRNGVACRAGKARVLTSHSANLKGQATTGGGKLMFSYYDYYCAWAHTHTIADDLAGLTCSRFHDGKGSSNSSAARCVRKLTVNCPSGGTMPSVRGSTCPREVNLELNGQFSEKLYPPNRLMGGWTFW